MSSLQLADGTLIKGLKQLNPLTFELISDDNSIYHQLNDFNLSFAVLLDEDGVMQEVYLDYMRQNFLYQNGVIRFRLIAAEELEKQMKHKEEKDREKELKKQQYNERVKKRRQKK